MRVSWMIKCPKKSDPVVKIFLALGSLLANSEAIFVKKKTVKRFCYSFGVMTHCIVNFQYNIWTFILFVIISQRLELLPKFFESNLISSTLFEKKSALVMLISLRTLFLILQYFLYASWRLCFLNLYKNSSLVLIRSNISAVIHGSALFLKRISFIGATVSKLDKNSFKMSACCIYTGRVIKYIPVCIF